MGPYKCPDCGIWWAGFEHRCQPSATTTGTHMTYTTTVNGTSDTSASAPLLVIDPVIQARLDRYVGGKP